MVTYAKDCHSLRVDFIPFVIEILFLDSKNAPANDLQDKKQGANPDNSKYWPSSGSIQ